MITLHLPSCLNLYEREANLIGDLVVRYGELEWMLCRVAALLLGDFDATFKAMYRVRGEQARLQIADGLASSHLYGSGIEEVWQETFRAVDICREIRNSYAHAHWFDQSAGELGFYHLEKLAKQTGAVALSTLARSKLTHAILADQTRFYAEVLNNLVHMFYLLDASETRSTPDTYFIMPLRAPLRAATISG
jgi:hypothetical protein